MYPILRVGFWIVVDGCSVRAGERTNLLAVSPQQLGSRLVATQTDCCDVDLWACRPVTEVCSLVEIWSESLQTTKILTISVRDLRAEY